MLQNAPISRISPVVVVVSYIRDFSSKAWVGKGKAGTVLTSDHQILGAVVTLGEDEPCFD
jgi:hypothetical protein